MTHASFLALVSLLGASGCDRLFGLSELAGLDAAHPPGDLAVAYSFDDPPGSVTLTDSSGNGNTAQVVGAGSAPGQYGMALQFDGNDRAQAPNSASLDITGTGFTVTLWLRIDTTPTQDQVIFGKPWGLQSGFVFPYYQYGVEFRPAQTSLYFFFGDEQGEMHQSWPLSVTTPDTFRHYAFTFDGADVRAYLDGVEQGTVAAPVRMTSRDTPLLVGSDGVIAQHLVGALDNLRIYRRSLDTSEIAADMVLPTVEQP